MTEKRLYHDIADKIINLIKEGIFIPGARLPSERELSERFGVSRVTVREAEIALQAKGLIEIRTGSGVYVSKKQPSFPSDAQHISAFELTEARSMVESEAAALAAQNISQRDLQKLDELINDMGSEDTALATAADNEFHITIAEATGNSAIVYTIKSLWRMRSELPQIKTAYESVCKIDATSRVKEHREIYDALEARNPMAARQAMRGHFRRLIEAMLDVSEKQALEKVHEQANASRERFLAITRM